jgi:hypothetical protein
MIIDDKRLLKSFSNPNVTKQKPINIPINK